MRISIIFTILYICVSIPPTSYGSQKPFSNLTFGASYSSIIKPNLYSVSGEFEKTDGFSFDVKIPAGIGFIDVGFERESDESSYEDLYVHRNKTANNIAYIGYSYCYTDSEILRIYPGLRLGNYAINSTSTYNGNKSTYNKSFAFAALAVRVHINIFERLGAFVDGSIKHVFMEDDPQLLLKLHCGLNYTLKIR